MASEDKILARLTAHFEAESQAVDAALAAILGKLPKWVPAPSVDRAKRIVQKLLSERFSAANLAKHVAEDMRDELTFPGIVSDPAAFAQSISELAHLKYATSLDEQDGLRLLSGNKAALGQKFSKGRKPSSPGPIRRAIAKHLKGDPEAKNAELWEAIKARPPRGWSGFDNRTGKYFEGPQNENMDYRRFRNVCAEERKKMKGKITD